MTSQDTNEHDLKEKLDILLKKSFGFPATSEKKLWYQEVNVEYNNYLNGEDLFLDTIPKTPDFDNNGTVRNANDIGLNFTDFEYYQDNNNKSYCSIVDDSTGTIRRFKYLKLDQCPNLGDDIGSSWYKLDNSNNNVLSDGIQFNFNKQIIDGSVYQPYLYSLYTQLSLEYHNLDLPFGRQGGNWIVDSKNGILIFSDFQNLSDTNIQPNSNFNINSNNNKPVFTFYKYIGRKGTQHINTTLNYLQNELTDIKELFNNYDISSIINNTSLLSNDVSNIKIKLLDLSNNFNDLSNTLFNNLINIDNSFNHFSNIIENLSNDSITITGDVSFINILNNNNFLMKNFILNFNLTDIAI